MSLFQNAALFHCYYFISVSQIRSIKQFNEILNTNIKYILGSDMPAILARYLVNHRIFTINVPITYNTSLFCAWSPNQTTHAYQVSIAGDLIYMRTFISTILKIYNRTKRKRKRKRKTAKCSDISKV